MIIRYRRDIVELMKHLNLPLTGVEIGVASGLFSRDLLQNGLDLLYSVDAWQTLDQAGDGAQPADWHLSNYENTVKLLTPFGDKSIILKGMASEMAAHIPDNSLGLAYHDSNHSYEAVSSDLNTYWSKLVVGGIFATHDYESPQYGTKKAFEEFAAANGLEIFLLPEDKGEDAGAYIIKNK